jgi:hypothetical protein
MAKLNEFDFKDFLQLAVSHLTPKSKENGKIVLQAIVEINGKNYLMRANAPNNYRRVYWKIEADQIQKLLDQDTSYPFWGEQITGHWVKAADHDSCWNEGLNPRRLIGNFSEMNIKQLQILQAKAVDYRVDAIADDLPVLKSIDLDGQDYWEAVVTLLKSFYQNTDSLEFSVRNRKDFHKTKNCRILSLDKMELGNTGKVVDFSATELKKYLKKPDDYEMDNHPTHRRDQTHFV